MKFPKVKTILYQSEEIQLIPDKWAESVPFRCELNGEEFDAFLYWNPSEEHVELKRLIGIHRHNGNITVLNAPDLVECFGLQAVIFSIPSVEDYDEFFHNKDEYESLYAELCASEDAFKSIGSKAYGLLRNIYGNELVDNLFSKIAGNYINKLQTEDC